MFAILGALMLLIGAAIWTSALKKAESINSYELTILASHSFVPLGFNVTPGPGLYLVWASFAVLLVSTVPYMVRCVPLTPRFGVIDPLAYHCLQLLHVPRIMPVMRVIMNESCCRQRTPRRSYLLTFSIRADGLYVVACVGWTDAYYIRKSIISMFIR
jgi:hypothetical protein